RSRPRAGCAGGAAPAQAHAAAGAAMVIAMGAAAHAHAGEPARGVARSRSFRAVVRAFVKVLLPGRGGRRGVPNARTPRKMGRSLLSSILR
ncbi:hypothetical protein, partial [Burkholderia pseudomallei]|uniref:hypothetical protein n=2 Tax=Burkholderia pseudomallei TaxID=28450 RepID=UPI001C80650F